MVWSHPINNSLTENVAANLIVALIFLIGAAALVAAVAGSVAVSRWAMSRHRKTVAPARTA